MGLIDLHTHTLLTDGELIPAELVSRARVNGYTAIGLTDHVDASNLEWIAEAMLRAAEALNRHQTVTVIPGVELTHVPPSQILNWPSALASWVCRSCALTARRPPSRSPLARTMLLWKPR